MVVQSAQHERGGAQLLFPCSRPSLSTQDAGENTSDWLLHSLKQVPDITAKTLSMPTQQQQQSLSVYALHTDTHVHAQLHAKEIEWLKLHADVKSEG